MTLSAGNWHPVAYTIYMAGFVAGWFGVRNGWLLFMNFQSEGARFG